MRQRSRGGLDREILDTLAAEMGEMFAERGVVRFACAYAANRVTVSRPVEQTYLMQPARASCWRGTATASICARSARF